MVADPAYRGLGSGTALLAQAEFGWSVCSSSSYAMGAEEGRPMARTEGLVLWYEIEWEPHSTETIDTLSLAATVSSSNEAIRSPSVDIADSLLRGGTSLEDQRLAN